MRLPWRHPNVTKMAEEARETRQQAEQELARAKERTPKFRAVTRRLQEAREENHLREAFEATFRARRSS